MSPSTLRMLSPRISPRTSSTLFVPMRSTPINSILPVLAPSMRAPSPRSSRRSPRKKSRGSWLWLHGLLWKTSSTCTSSRLLQRPSSQRRRGRTTLLRLTMRSLFARTARRSKGLWIASSDTILRLIFIPYRVWFRPRILRDVSTVDWSTTILGQKSSLPVYIVSYPQCAWATII